MERDGRNFEAEPDHQECETGCEETVLENDLLGEVRRNVVEVRRTGRSVGEGYAVEEDRRRKATEHEVLQGGLLRLHPTQM